MIPILVPHWQRYKRKQSGNWNWDHKELDKSRKWFAWEVLLNALFCVGTGSSSTEVKRLLKWEWFYAKSYSMLSKSRWNADITWKLIEPNSRLYGAELIQKSPENGQQYISQEYQFLMCVMESFYIFIFSLLCILFLSKCFRDSFWPF